MEEPRIVPPLVCPPSVPVPSRIFPLARGRIDPFSVFFFFFYYIYIFFLPPADFSRGSAQICYFLPLSTPRSLITSWSGSVASRPTLKSSCTHEPVTRRHPPVMLSVENPGPLLGDPLTHHAWHNAVVMSVVVRQAGDGGSAGVWWWMLPLPRFTTGANSFRCRTRGVTQLDGTFCSLHPEPPALFPFLSWQLFFFF